MARRIADFDWAATALGPITAWPPALKTAVGVVVHARFASALVWGPSLITFHNDRYTDVVDGIGDALGRSFSDLLDGSWPTVEPMVAVAFAGNATYVEDLPLTIVGDGHEKTGYFTCSCSAVPDEAGAVAGVIVLMIETTGRIAEQQLAEAEERLRQAQKMEVFGQLTGGIAHDFNNLLQAVSGSLEMLGRKHVHNDDGHRLLRLGGQALDRAAHLTRQLLAFARKQSLDVRAIDADGAMATSIELARRSLPENITISQRLQAGAWPMLSDANQLDVAMLNLIINARDAMPDGGSIVVSTTNVEVPSADLSSGLPSDLAAGPYVQIAITDSGTGMTDDVLARVFEPFFTTKGVGKGTGLGLSQVYGFAHQSGGSVAIESAVGRGTTVRIFLPRAETDEIPAVEAPDRGVWRGRETVLVVDDDRDVRELAVACLQEYGYRVLEAASGVECLELLGREASVDLLLIDYAMPEMNGAETVRLARRIRPALEVLFITGYADLRALHEHVGPNAIVQKPFKLAQLAERVASGLARRSATVATVA